MSRFEIRISGLGGQGIVLAGIIIGTAASTYGRKNATQAQSYGPEARGGACKTEIVISDEEIDYPRVEKPHIVAVMSQEAYNTCVGEIEENGALLYDPDMILETRPMNKVNIYEVPATRIAEQLGKKIVANMVMIGAIIAITNIVDNQSIEKAIAKNVPHGTEKLNIDAFNRGYEHARKLLEKMESETKAQSSRIHLPCGFS